MASLGAHPGGPRASAEEQVGDQHRADQADQVGPQPAGERVARVLMPTLPKYTAST